MVRQYSDEAVAIFRRSSALDKRRKLMETWASYCGPKKVGKVVEMRRQYASAIHEASSARRTELIFDELADHIS